MLVLRQVHTDNGSVLDPIFRKSITVRSTKKVTMYTIKSSEVAQVYLEK